MGSEIWPQIIFEGSDANLLYLFFYFSSVNLKMAKCKMRECAVKCQTNVWQYSVARKSRVREQRAPLADANLLKI